MKFLKVLTLSLMMLFSITNLYAEDEASSAYKPICLTGTMVTKEKKTKDGKTRNFFYIKDGEGKLTRIPVSKKANKTKDKVNVKDFKDKKVEIKALCKKLKNGKMQVKQISELKEITE